MGDDPTYAATLAAVDGAAAVIERVDVSVTHALFAATPPLPPFVLLQWRSAASEVRGFVADLRAEVAASGDTWTIRGAAQQWTVVASLVKAAAAEIEDDQLVADDRLAGTAATAYREALPAQRDAYATAFKDVAHRVAAELEELADLTSAYLAAAAQLALELAIGCLTLGASLSGASVAEALRQVAGFVVSSRSSIETWLDALLAFAEHSGDIAQRWLDLRQDTGHPALPGGSWPVAVVPGFARTRR